jgi:dihydrofolate reductase
LQFFSAPIATIGGVTDREALKSAWAKNEAEVNRVRSMSPLNRELFAGRIDQLETEQDALLSSARSMSICRPSRAPQRARGAQAMSKVKVSISVSVDGFAAGPQQSLENPQGIGGLALLEWAFATPTFQRMHRKDWTVQGIDREHGGTTGIDDDFFARSFLNVGAYIFGRNMFGPLQGLWHDDSWKGPWGDTPPFRNPVFVLTHYPRESIPMQGGTTFHFVTEGIHHALERATAVANGKDVCLAGVATAQQYLRAALIDELHLAICPVLLGSGERFLGDIDLVRLGYTCTEHVAGERATHVVLRRHATY